MFKWIRNKIRKPIVDRRIRKGRYVPAPGGVNAYYDMKRNGIIVKGYFDQPFSFTTPMMKFDNPGE